MSGFRVFLFVSLAVLSSSACATPARPTPSLPMTDETIKILADSSVAAVRVNVFRHWHAAGVIVSKDGLILTCEHTVRHVGRADVVATVTDRFGRTLPAAVLARDPSRDLALLKVDMTFSNVAELADPAAVSDGERFFGFGVAGTKAANITLGSVKSASYVIDRRPAEPANFKNGILAEMPAASCVSGQGLFSAKTGRLVGINTARTLNEDGQDLSVLVSSDEIRGFLAENGINLK